MRGLSNRDKHRVLNPPLLTTHLIEFHDPALMRRATAEMWYPPPLHRLEVGTEIARAPFPPDVDAEMEVAGYVAPDIRFPEGDFRIMYGVDLMTATVEGIVNDIEALI